MGSTVQQKGQQDRHSGVNQASGTAAITVHYGRFTSFLCGGSLINDRYILTSARCVHMLPANMIGVTLASMMTTNHSAVAPILPVRRVIIHEKYARYFRRRRQHVFNDIALLQLVHPVKLDDGSITPVCLPQTDVKDESVWISGWAYPRVSGRFASMPVLTESPVKEQDSASCAKLFVRALRYNEKSTTCASGTIGVCFKDEGTPLFARRNGHIFQTALVSVSRGFADCGHRPKVPTIFEKVVNHMDWIRSKTNDGRWCWTPDSMRKEEENEIKDDFFPDFKSFGDAKDVEISHPNA